MASVSVNYNFSCFRIKLTPNTVMNDVLSQSLSHFKLVDEKSQSTETRWVLEHNKKPLALDVPWRFLNLSAGVNLELKKGTPVATTDKTSSIRIKILVSGYPTVVEVIKSSADLKDMIDILASKHGWSINLSESKLQVFSKTIPYAELRGLSLINVGVNDSVLLRLVCPSSSQPSQWHSVEKQSTTNGQIDVDDKTGVSHEKEPESKKHDLHKISAFIPPENSIASQLRDEVEDDDDFEITVDQARAYQKMLSKQTGNLGGPLLSKRLREEKERAQKPIVSECTIRVRFPDLKHIEVTFHPSEDMRTVYNIISESILSEHLDFTLSQPHPYTVYPRDDSTLVDDLAFGTKTLLLFNSQKEGPYLKDTILKDAKQLREADDVRLDRVDLNTDRNSDGGVMGFKAKPKGASQASKIDKVPKWLKLSKK